MFSWTLQHSQQNVLGTTINNAKVIMVDVGVNVMIKCNLCSFEIDENDDLLNERKVRHEERHDGTIYKFQNIIRGKVIWLVD